MDELDDNLKQYFSRNHGMCTVTIVCQWGTASIRSRKVASGNWLVAKVAQVSFCRIT